MTWMLFHKLGQRKQRTVEVSFETLDESHLPTGVRMSGVRCKHLLQLRFRVIVSTLAPKLKPSLISRGEIHG